MNNDTVKFASVTITIRCGDKEIVYDLPKVKNPMTEVKYEEPEIRKDMLRFERESQIELFSISMQPFKVDGIYYTITETTHAVQITDVYES